MIDPNKTLVTGACAKKSCQKPRSGVKPLESLLCQDVSAQLGTSGTTRREGRKELHRETVDESVSVRDALCREGGGGNRPNSIHSFVPRVRVPHHE